jgi:TonB-linked SusC/RagA family outer membrane protein
VQGTTDGTVTDVDGAFRFTTDKAPPIILKVSYVGYAEQTVTYSGRPVRIVLKENVEALDEVVVTAGGIFRARREQGYASLKITDQELVAGKAPSLAGGLTAKIPGLQVNAISGGVNPTYRLILRGNRSINGNNEALIVVDNAIVSNDFLNNINPQDIDNIQVLNGAAGSALYGSEASNGVLLVTTKAGTKGRTQIKVSHTTTFDQVSFFPKLQTRFGQGSSSSQEFDPIENQQYGPAFDGSQRELGYPLEDGSQQYVAFSPASNGRNSFWETGVQNQEDISVSFGNDNITSYVSAQYLSATSTTPYDKYNKISIRLNNTQKVTNTISLAYNVSYVENNYDITQATATLYDQLTQISANVPVTDYKDWQNNKWATLDGWYNPWYRNPYWTAANYREDRKDSYVTGKAELRWNILPWLSALYRASIANRYNQSHQQSAGATYSDYSVKVQTKSNLAAYIMDSQRNSYRFNQDFQLAMNKAFGDISVNATLGWSYVNSRQKNLTLGAQGLVIPGLYNIANRLNDAYIPTTDIAYSATIPAIAKNPNHSLHSRNYGIWADVVLGYKNFAFLHLSGRDDHTSLLSPENREYFYPAADASFIATDAIEALKDNETLDYLKIRAGWSKVGNVNIDPYSLVPTYTSTTGFSNGTYFREGADQVSNLKPEITTGWEVGTEFRLLKNLAEVQLTYYQTSTTGQAISASIAPSSAYTSILINAGEITNAGVETSLRLNPIRTKDWNVSVGGNYTYNKNLLKSLYPGLTSIGVNGSSVIFAMVGHEINQIYVSDYARVPEYYEKEDGSKVYYPKDQVGKVIVDPKTGYPSRAASSSMMGNTTPRHRLGLDLSVRWKNVTFSSVFEYRGGYNYISTSMGTGLDFSGASARTAYYNRERFVFPGSVLISGSDGNGQPTYTPNDNVTISDGVYNFWAGSAYNRTGAYSNYVYAGDYWKWRELAISYQVPKSFVNELTNGLVQDVTISVQGRNLLLLTPASNEYTDPDLSANENNAIGVSTLSSSPPSRYYGGTISFTF